MVWVGASPGFLTDQNGIMIEPHRTRGPHSYRILNALDIAARQLSDSDWDRRHENTAELHTYFSKAMEETLKFEEDIERPPREDVRGNTLSLTWNRCSLPRGVPSGESGFFKEPEPTLSGLPKAEIFFSTGHLDDSLVNSGIEIAIDGTAEDLECPHATVSLKSAYVQTHAKIIAAALRYVQDDLRALNRLDPSFDPNFDKVRLDTEHTIKSIAGDLKRRLIHFALEEQNFDRERPEGSNATERSRPVMTENLEGLPSISVTCVADYRRLGDDGTVQDE